MYLRDYVDSNIKTDIQISSLDMLYIWDNLGLITSGYWYSSMLIASLLSREVKSIECIDTNKIYVLLEGPTKRYADVKLKIYFNDGHTRVISDVRNFNMVVRNVCEYYEANTISVETSESNIELQFDKIKSINIFTGKEKD